MSSSSATYSGAFVIVRRRELVGRRRSVFGTISRLAGGGKTKENWQVTGPGQVETRRRRASFGFSRHLVSPNHRFHANGKQGVVESVPVSHRCGIAADLACGLDLLDLGWRA